MGAAAASRPAGQYGRRHQPGLCRVDWQYDFAAGPFVAGSLGLAIHDGELDTERSDRKALGGRVLFRESVEIGYRFGEAHRHAVSVMLSHISNAGIYERNEGMDTIAARYGIRF